MMSSLATEIGDSLISTFDKAKSLSKESNHIIVFDFNGYRFFITGESEFESIKEGYHDHLRDMDERLLAAKKEMKSK